MESSKHKALTATYRDGLLKDTIPFWQTHTPDLQHGGFMTFLDAGGSVVSTDKPMWVIGRVSWLFAYLYKRVEKCEEWLRFSRHGIDIMCKYGFDTDGVVLSYDL